MLYISSGKIFFVIDILSIRILRILCNSEMTLLVFTDSKNHFRLSCIQLLLDILMLSFGNFDNPRSAIVCTFTIIG